MQHYRPVKSYGRVRGSWTDPQRELPDSPRVAAKVLASDNSGNYAVPFAVVYDDGWRNAVTRERLEVDVVGWCPW